MREIAFRAWNIEQRRMWYAVECAYDYIVGHEHPLNDEDAVPATHFAEILGTPDTWIPMQFTGLLDKNGVEIYESDVIEIIWEWDGKRTIHEVYWGGEYPAFDLRPTTGDESNNLHSLMVCRENEIAVIGNIHQNPDLLELSNIEKT